jgi:hypothetical protein
MMKANKRRIIVKSEKSQRLKINEDCKDEVRTIKKSNMKQDGYEF